MKLRLSYLLQLKSYLKWLWCAALLFFIKSAVYGFSPSDVKRILTPFIPADTVKFELASGIINGAWIEVPVTISCADTVNALDFSFRYNHNHVELDSVLSLTTGLQYLYHFNPQDSVFRFTSNRLIPYPCDSPLIVLRFLMFNGQFCSYDLDSIITYINGEVCHHTIASCIISNLTSVPDISYNVYPNPAYDVVYVNVPANTTITMINERGQLVSEWMMSEPGERTISVGSFPHGLYLLMIQSSEGTAVRKVILSR